MHVTRKDEKMERHCLETQEKKIVGTGTIPCVYLYTDICRKRK